MGTTKMLLIILPFHRKTVSAHNYGNYGISGMVNVEAASGSVNCDGCLPRTVWVIIFALTFSSKQVSVTQGFVSDRSDCLTVFLNPEDLCRSSSLTLLRTAKKSKKKIIMISHNLISLSDTHLHVNLLLKR